ncbi:hypothetical protein AY606_13430 [Acinetobacter sp. SFB]|uniref:hypothetical protein n=1 Tax=Acinetobacter sp. SFB TaxID=1805634 RepID=UPI0007D7C86A|nr:hypothetical protein [Acinetobacter sp. SFB]OAL76306.1 hypothetical protein AY606_13430 [Acinetobacter sp. SFB]
MPKLHKLKEISAKSSCGTEITVEQIYERVLSDASNDETWIPLPKIALTDKVIDLSHDETFVHPRTGVVFKVLMDQYSQSIMIN